MLLCNSHTDSRRLLHAAGAVHKFELHPWLLCIKDCCLTKKAITSRMWLLQWQCIKYSNGSCRCVWDSPTKQCFSDSILVSIHLKMRAQLLTTSWLVAHRIWLGFSSAIMCANKHCKLTIGQHSSENDSSVFSLTINDHISDVCKHPYFHI